MTTERPPRHGSFAYREVVPDEDESPPSACKNKRVLSALSRLSALRGNARGSEELAARAAVVAESERTLRKRALPADERAARLREAAYVSSEVQAFGECIRRFSALEELEPLGVVDRAVLSRALQAVGRRSEAATLRRELLAAPIAPADVERIPPGVALELGTLLYDLGDLRAHVVLAGAVRAVEGRRHLLTLDVLLTAADAALVASARAAAVAHVRAARSLAAELDPEGGFFGRVIAREAAIVHHDGRLPEAEAAFAEAARRGFRADLALTALLLDQQRLGEADLLSEEHLRCLRSLGFEGSPALCPALRMRARAIEALGQAERAACVRREHDEIVRGILSARPVPSSTR